MTRWCLVALIVLAVAGLAPGVLAGSPGSRDVVEPDLYLATLASGQRVAVRERPGSEVVAISVGIRGGSRVEDDETLGAAHFMEHMFFQGTPRRPTSTDIDRELEALGGWINAWTGLESINFQVVVPTEGLELALDVVSDLLANSLFSPDKLEKERRVVFEELSRRMTSPSQRAYDAFWLELFSDHPARRLPGGSRQTVETISMDTLLRYRDAYFVANNMVVAVVGDVDHRRVIPMVEAAFAAMPVEPLPDAEASSRPVDRPRRVDLVSVGQQARIVVGSTAPGRDDPDRYVLRVINAVLGPAGRRLQREIVDRRALVSAVGVRYQEMSDVGAWFVEAATSPALVEDVLSSVSLVTGALVTTRLEPSDLDDAKRFVRGSRLLGRERSVDLAVELADGLALDYYESVDRYLAQIDAVTADDVLRVARRYLLPERQLTVVLRP